MIFKKLVSTLTTVFTILGVGISVARAANITNIEAPGNLQSLNDIGCASSDTLQNTYTPADLYRGVAECVRRNNYDSAVYLSALAGVYGRYDTMRVSDQSAQQAQNVVQIKYMDSLTEDQKKTYMAKLSSVASNPEKLASLCDDIRKIGPPSYQPTYMIQHGMGAFLGGGVNGLVSNFDSAPAWEKSLGTYLHCPKQ